MPETRQGSLFPEETGAYRLEGATQRVELDRSSGKAIRPGSGFCDGFDYTINPYVGCLHGCQYCYAVGFLGDKAQEDTWGQWVKAKTRAASDVAAIDTQGKRIALGTATDPYQNVENTARLSRRILEVLERPEKKPKTLCIITKGTLLLRDLDILRRNTDWIEITISIPSDDEAIRLALEPSTPKIEARLQMLETLRKNGVTAGINLCPTIRVKDPEGFVSRLISADASHLGLGMPYPPKIDGVYKAATPRHGFQTLQELGWTYEESYDTIKKIQALWRGDYSPEGVA